MRLARHKVFHTIGGCRVHDTGTRVECDVVAQVDRRYATVAFVHGVKRMVEFKIGEFVAGGGGDDIAFQTPFLKAGFDPVFGQEQQRAAATRFVQAHQGVLELGVYVQRLVGGNGPGCGGPDHDGAVLGVGAPEGGGHGGRVDKWKGDVDRRVVTVGV